MTVCTCGPVLAKQSLNGMQACSLSQASNHNLGRFVGICAREAVASSAVQSLQTDLQSLA